MAQLAPLGIQGADGVGIHLRELLLLVEHLSDVGDGRGLIGFINVARMHQSRPLTMMGQGLVFPAVVVVPGGGGDGIAVRIHTASGRQMGDGNGLSIHKAEAAIVGGGVQIAEEQAVRISLLQSGLILGCVVEQCHRFLPPMDRYLARIIFRRDWAAPRRN